MAEGVRKGDEKMNENRYEFVASRESDKIARSLLVWMNEYPGKPVSVINYEYLPSDQPGMAMSAIQGAYKTVKYLRGAYSAEYQFKVIYRVQPGNSNDKRLKADEELDALGDWAVSSSVRPELGELKQFTKLEINSPSALFARYDDGSEDHQILMTMEYNSF